MQLWENVCNFPSNQNTNVPVHIIWRNITGNQLPTLQNHFKLTNFLIGESYVFTVKWFSFNDFYSNPSTLAAFEMGKSI